MDPFALFVQKINAGETIPIASVTKAFVYVARHDIEFDPESAQKALLGATPPQSLDECSALFVQHEDALNNPLNGLLLRHLRKSIISHFIAQEQKILQQRRSSAQAIKHLFDITVQPSHIIDALQMLVKRKKFMPFAQFRALVKKTIDNIDVKDLNDLLEGCHEGYLSTHDQEYVQLGAYISQELQKKYNRKN
jgi:hypothetical protein